MPARRAGRRRGLRSAGRSLAAVGCSALALGCGAAPSGSPERWPTAPPTGAEWRDLHHALRALRSAHTPTGSYTMRLALELREPQSGRRLRARGAVAVDPAARGFRMILLGPGGTTALDLWSCDDRFRLAIPAVDLVRRGDASSPDDALRGLPVGFLRWWLLEPLAGRLLYAARVADSARFVVWQDGAVLDVRQRPGGELAVERRRSAERERVESSGTPCPQVRYWEQSTGLDIHVSCEGLDAERPVTEAALADPDDPTHLCRRDRGSAP